MSSSIRVLLFSLFFVTVYNNPLNLETKNENGLKDVLEYRRESQISEDEKPNLHPRVNPIADVVCNLDQSIIDEIRSYQTNVNQIIELFLTGPLRGKTYDRLANLTDTFGPRMTGSLALDNAIDWVVETSLSDGFDNAYTENLTAPYWIRNDESLMMIAPRIQKMSMLGLGSSIGTPVEGIVASVLVVSSFDELTALADAAVGKIVVYDVPYVSYGATVDYRSRGAAEAARVGAVASLVRSVTPFSINSPHTGHQNYDGSVPKIPAACITIEDAAMMHRMQERGQEITLHLTMGAENFPDVNTRNTIVDLEGSFKPEEIVVVSGHLDSWDVGTGAMDDAGGCTVSWMVGMALMNLGLRPSRTIRTVMFTAEEQGIFGGDAYFAAHQSEVENFQLMMESDGGTFYPRGISFSGTDEGICMMQEILALTSLLGTTQLSTPAGTSDLGGFGSRGVPLGSLISDSENYFYFHHSNGDHMEVYDSDALDRVSALWASVAYVTADVGFRLPHIPVKI